MAKKQVEEITETIENTEEISNAKDKKLSKRYISSQLRKNRKDIMVEIMNIGYKECCYFDYNERPYFELKPGELEILSLENLNEVTSRAKGLFKEYDLIVTDVEDEDYTVDDVIEYLGLARLYKNIENANTDFLEELIYESDLDEFKDTVRSSSPEFNRALGGKMLVIFKDKTQRRDLDMDKMRVIAKKLRIREIVEEIMTEDF